MNLLRPLEEVGYTQFSQVRRTIRMNLIRKLYDWTLEKSNHPKAA